MVSTRFLQVVNTLGKEDLKLLEKYLCSPFHNSNKNIIRLFKYIKTICPEPDNNKLQLEELHKKVFPSKKYNEKIIRNLVYEFNGTVENYFCYLNFSKDEFARQRHLLEELNIRGLDKLLDENLKKADEILSEKPVRDDHYYSSKIFLEQIRYAKELKDVPIGKSLVLSNIKKEYIKNVSGYIILVMLREYFEKQNREVQINYDIELSLSQYLLDYLKTEIENFKDEPAIYLLYQFLNLNDKTPEEQFYNLKKLVTANKEKISSLYFRDFYMQLYNYCKLREREGNKKFGIESYELIKYMKENNLLVENEGMILEHNYINIVATVVRLREIQWAKQFINDYKEKLPEKIRENAYNYSMAAVHFVDSASQNKNMQLKYLDTALEYLSKVKTTDFYYTTRVNNLQMMVYYEKDDIEPLFNMIDSYRHFLHNNKLIPDALKNRYLNFTNFMNRLINFKSGTKISSIDKLKKDVLSADTEYKQWLLEKMDEAD